MRTDHVMTATTTAMLLGLLAVLVGCSSPSRTDLARLYSRQASEGANDRNPVLVIPGILGSRLRDTETDKLAWGAFAGEYADPRTTDGMRTISLPMAIGTPLDELTDSVAADGALDTVEANVLFLPIQVSAYREILLTLGVGGYRDRQLGEAGAVDYGTDHYT
ncbi:MAG: hypothetical protein AAF747_01075, partial [Planctomycetota bacterium]